MWSRLVAQEVEEFAGNTEGLLVPLASLQQGPNAERERLVMVGEALKEKAGWDKQGKNLYCPQRDCNRSLMCVNSSKKRPHFRHAHACRAAGGAGGQGEGPVHLLAKTLIAACLAKFRFKWAQCQDGQCCFQERRFGSCHAVLEQTLGSLGQHHVSLTPAEARLRPDVTLLDERGKPLAFLEIWVTCRKEQKHWDVYSKFAGVQALELDFTQGPPSKLPDGTYRVAAASSRQLPARCAACAAQHERSVAEARQEEQRRTEERERAREQRRVEEQRRIEERERAREQRRAEEQERTEEEKRQRAEAEERQRLAAFQAARAGRLMGALPGWLTDEEVALMPVLALARGTQQGSVWLPRRAP